MDLHVYRNSQDRWHDLRSAARRSGAVLATNCVTLDELVQRLTPDLKTASTAQRLVLIGRGGRHAYDAVRELKGGRIQSAELRHAGVEDLADILDHYNGGLAAAGLVDPNDRRWIASLRVAQGHPWVQQFERVIIHAIYDLNECEFALIHNLIEALPDGGTVILFNSTANVKPTQFAEWTWQRFVRDEALADKTFPEFCRSSGPAADLLERLFVWENQENAECGMRNAESGSTIPHSAFRTPHSSSGFLRIHQTRGRYAEVEAIGSEIADLLAGGADANEMAIVVRHIDTYGELLEDVFSRYEIPHAFETGIPLVRIPFIKYWMALLDAVAGERSRDALSRVMSSAYFEPRLSPAIDVAQTLIEIGYIDRNHLKASVLAARRNSVLTTELERIESLFDRLETAVEKPKAFLSQLQPGSNLTERDRQAWRTLTEELEAIDALVEPLSFSNFRRIASETAGLRTIERFSGRSVPPGIPRVRIMSPSALGARSYRYVFAPGFADGEIPGRANPNSLLTDGIIESLNKKSRSRRLLTSRDKNRAEPLYLFMLFDTATERVTLTLPGSTLEGETIYPSIYIGEILRHCGGMGDGKIPGLTGDFPISATQEIGKSPVRPGIFPSPPGWFDPGEYVRHVADCWRRELIGESHVRSLLGDDIVRRALWERRGPMRADLGAGALPVDAIFSPSELNSLALCPFVFLSKHRLRLRPQEVPDFEVPPAEVGNLAHRILREFYSEPIPDSEEAAATRMQDIVGRRLAPIDINGQGPTLVIDPALWKIRRPQLVNALFEYVKFAVRDARDGYETLPEYLDRALPAALLGKTQLAGRPDHVAIRRSGGVLSGIRIDDFKYSAASSATTRQLKQSFQIPVYAYLVSKALNADKGIPMEGRYLLLRSPSNPVVAHPIDEVIFDEISIRIEGLLRMYEAGDCIPLPPTNRNALPAITGGCAVSMDRNTVVWASAGTGKTRKLVETYVSLLEKGIDPLRIAALTFTEKAAGEMRDRIRTAIGGKCGMRNAECGMEEAGSSTPHSAIRIPQSAAFWMQRLAMLPAAPISTIHGFCGLLLREHGLHLGIDPSFSILDEQRSLDLARESAVDTIRHEIRSGNAETARLFGDLGLDVLTDTIVRAAYWLNSLGKDAQWLNERVSDQQAAAAQWSEKFSADIARYGGNPERIGELADEVDAKKARHPLRKRDDPQAILPRIGQIAGVPVARELSRLVLLSRERFRLHKSAANSLDFDDLLLGVRDLLKTSDSVRRHYQDRFQALLVDEFQDTDEVQAEIIQLLTRNPEDESQFAVGKLLIVGDPKQSIYRFRRARVTVFIRMMKQILEQGGVIEHLQENYRSAGPIVEFSNRLSELMMDGAGKCAVPEHVDLAYRIPFSQDDILKPASKRPFLGIAYIAADAEARAAAGRQMQAEALARLLKGWKSSGTIQSWREVAVLMRVTTNVGLMVDALEAHHIPVYVVQGTSFYQKSEVSDLIAMLELVLRPGDPVLRATVLSSSLAGLTFKELLEGKSSSALDDILKPWIEQRDRATAAEILQDVIRRTNFDAVLMAQKNGPQRVANVGKLIEITRGLAREGTNALDDIVRRLRDRARDTTVREAEAQIVGQDDEVVRILTVHQAKGLEFDIVVIPDLAAKMRGSSGDRAVFSDRWGILAGASYGLHRRALPHALILESKDEDEDQQYEEEKRLLYVAVTRARRMLVLGEGFAMNAGLWLEWVERLFETVQPGVIDKARGGAKARVRFRGRGEDFTVEMLPVTAFIRPEQLALGIDATAINQESEYGALKEFGIRNSDFGFRTEDPPNSEFRNPKSEIRIPVPSLEMTPSDLLALHGCFRHFHWTRLLGLSEPGRLPTGDTPQMRLGSAAHKALEDQLTDPAALKLKGLGDLQAVFASEDWRAIADLPIERELPFIMHVQASGKDCFVRGRMDAVVPGDPPRVIDYKFALWKEGAESVYQMQMAAYSLALMKGTGADRAVSELWYLKSPMKIVRREYAREEAEGLLAELLDRYVTALQSRDWPKADRTYCDRIECGFRPECWG